MPGYGSAMDTFHFTIETEAKCENQQNRVNQIRQRAKELEIKHPDLTPKQCLALAKEEF